MRVQLHRGLLVCGLVSTITMLLSSSCSACPRCNTSPFVMPVANRKNVDELSDKISGLIQLLKSTEEEQQSHGLQIAARLKGRLRGNKQVISLVSKLTRSSNDNISLEAVAALAFIGDSSSRKELRQFLKSPSVAKRFFSAAGLLNIPRINRKDTSKAVSTLLALTSVNPDTEHKRKILFGVADVLGRLAAKANMQQPAFPILSRNNKPVDAETVAKHWKQYSVQLRHWWSQNKNKVIESVYDKKKERKPLTKQENELTAPGGAKK